MHEGKPLELTTFDSPNNPLEYLSDSLQLSYIKGYLAGLDVVSIIVEANYFDRDYLDEFSAFYSKSARGYTNICKRLHFFNTELNTQDLHEALGGNNNKLQKGYLGFLVLRPLEQTPFGRTVLSWYPNTDERSERITPVLREYISNILGLQLKVKGIPWQQQDRGVSACATVALWSMFHSSAFDANHSIPTTVEITKNALGVSSGNRAFPSQGLSIVELKEAIYAQNLSPKILMPTKYDKNSQTAGFSVEYMASMCAANIRSGYPVLLVGDYTHATSPQQHAICCIGFREQEQKPKEEGSSSTMDDETRIFYIHDDNIGPNVRCQLIDQNGFAVLETAQPDYIDPENIHPQPAFHFRPKMMIIAVHEEIRMDAESLINQAKTVATILSNLLNESYKQALLPHPAISYNAQFLDVRKFYSEHLAQVINNNSDLLGQVRAKLGSDAPPLCLHIGLVSIGIASSELVRLVDIIYDTTDSAIKCPVIAHIIYDPQLLTILNQFPSDAVSSIFGCQIIGFEIAS